MDRSPSFVHRFFESLRFPQLLLVTAALFVVDLMLPDAIPLIDELLLGLATLILTQLRRRPEPAPRR